jgi:hypothetical protein
VDFPLLPRSRTRRLTSISQQPPIFMTQSQSYVTTDGQSANLFCYQAPIWSPRRNCYYYQTVAGLLMWRVHSDERTGLSFTISACPRQRSRSRVRVRRDSRPYFTVKVKVTLLLTLSQSVSLGFEPHVELMTRYLLLLESNGLVFLGRPL